MGLPQYGCSDPGAKHPILKSSNYLMRVVLLFLRVTRWPNLVLILLTQVMFKYCVIDTVLRNAGIVGSMQGRYFALIALAYMLVAGAGYIINDYIDLPIDLINKPHKVFITRGISPAAALYTYIGMNALALACAAIISIQLQEWWAIGSIACCILLLYAYSLRFKKSFLIGNLIVSLTTASSIFVLSCIETKTITLNGIPVVSRPLFILSLVYSGFACLISFVREVVKDMEDMEGDKQYGANTIAIAWGKRTTSVLLAVCIILLIVVLLVLLWVTPLSGWWLSLAVFVCVLIVLPLIWITARLFLAQARKDYHLLSSALKLVMLMGILSMLFFKAIVV